MKSLIIVHSYHHNNTRKVADAMADVLGADVKTAVSADSNDPNGYDIVGFGAGIDSGMHYKELLDFADSIDIADGSKKCFIFSTSAVQGKRKVAGDHKKLRGILTAKGYRVLDEFSCKGFNTNLFLKHIGGMNKSHPDNTDIAQARQFAKSLLNV